MIFFGENEPLQNNHLKEYRDKNLRKAKLREVMGKFEGHFIVAAIKQQWHNLLTNYKEKSSVRKVRNLQGQEVQKFTHLTGLIIFQCHSVTMKYNTHEMHDSQNYLSPSAIPEKKRNFPPKLPQKMMNFHQRQIYGRHSTTK